MSQIKKKFIKNDAIDGTKVLFLNNESFRIKNSSGSDVNLFKLDGSDMFQMLVMPKVSSDPSNSNDLSRKSYVDAGDSAVQSAANAYTDQKIADLVDGAPALLNTLNELAAAINDDANFASTVLGQISSEETARMAADALIQSELDATQVGAGLGSDGSYTSHSSSNYIKSSDFSSASVTASLHNADKLLDAALKAEVDARIADVDAEQSAREAAISAEQSARESADDALDARLDTIEGIGEGSIAKALQDAKDYADVIDTDLQGQIDTEKSRIDAILLASDADKDSFAEIVSLINSVDTTNDTAFASYVLSNDAALAQEVSDRQSGDSGLQSELDATQSGAGLNSDGSYAGHATSNYLKTTDFTAASLTQSLNSANKLLDSAIKAEVDARIAAVSAEQSARETADEELSDRIYALETFVPAAPTKEKFTLTSTDISNGYINLGEVVTPNSEMIFVGSLYMHPTDSYTLSTVDGVTRVTWANEVAAGGATELVEGDVVYVRYYA